MKYWYLVSKKKKKKMSSNNFYVRSSWMTIMKNFRKEKIFSLGAAPRRAPARDDYRKTRFLPNYVFRNIGTDISGTTTDNFKNFFSLCRG